MPKRRTTKINLTHRSRVLQAQIITPRIMWIRARRVMSWSFKLLFLVILLGAAGYGIWDYGKKNFLENPEYELRVIKLSPNNAFDEGDVVTIGEIPLQESIFGISLGDVEKRLQARPEIIKARISRELPATLCVELEVRQPFAWVQCHARGMQARTREQGYLIDRAGCLYPCPPRQFEQALPLPVIVIAAEEASLLVPGQVVESKYFGRALRLLEIAEKTLPDQGPWIDSVQPDKPWAIKVWTRTGTEALFGLDSHETQMENFVIAMKHAAHQGQQIAQINLIPERNLPVILRQPNSAATAPTRNQRSSSQP
ncbi:MAG: FtsQ-type POTRA domain-containing protein [Verrucomicrobia bacterium]|nr:MAG: FtsQ-type POTRA domain-containing protein [Verrucomicrobiota bacterium]TAE90688.1 MAG: FtsQ-type POTRA domain-containing protein [Verrucomicrobiota bacterium]